MVPFEAAAYLIFYSLFTFFFFFLGGGGVGWRWEVRVMDAEEIGYLRLEYGGEVTSRPKHHMLYPHPLLHVGIILWMPCMVRKMDICPH